MAVAAVGGGGRPAAEPAHAPTSRPASLIGRMTLEEKVAPHPTVEVGSSSRDPRLRGQIEVRHGA